MADVPASPRYSMGTKSSERRTSPIRKTLPERPGTPTRNRPTTPTLGRRPITPTLGRRGSNASLRQGSNATLNRPVTPTGRDVDPVKAYSAISAASRMTAVPGSPETPARILPAIPESPLVMPSPRSRQVSQVGVTPRSRQVSRTDCRQRSSCSRDC
jgi:hypothetical protein